MTPEAKCLSLFRYFIVSFFSDSKYIAVKQDYGYKTKNWKWLTWNQN